MKITVVGIGAVGGVLAARLHQAGHAVAAFARGATLAALRRDGLVLESAAGTTRHALPASDDPAALPAADLVILALKGPALADAAPALAPLWRHGAPVLAAMNGVPWWFLAPGQAPVAAALRSVDPEGAIAAAWPLAQVLHGVVHMSCTSPAPGVVRQVQGARLIVGAPAGGAAAHVAPAVAALQGAGFAAEASADIRRDLWYKLWGNMTMNPVSALTGASADRILDDPLVHDFMARAMAEAAAVGARVGCPIAEGAADRMAVTRKLGAFKTSMLQDAEAGRRLELDALVGAVREIGQAVGVATPEIDTLFGLARLMGRTRGLY